MTNQTTVNTKWMGWGNSAVYEVNAGAAYTFLLAQFPVFGQMEVVKDSGGNSATNNITVSGNGNLIDGSSTFVMSQNYMSVLFYFDGIQWVVTSTANQTTLPSPVIPGGTNGQVQYNNSGAFGGLTNTQLAADVTSGQTYFNVLNYGATGNGKALTDVTTTSSSAVISSASYTFVAGDVGKYITIAGAGAAGAVLNTTISSVAGGNATLATTAGTSKAGNGVATFGTDDSAAFQGAVNAANTAGGGVVIAPPGIYVTASTITWKSLVSLQGFGWGITVLKWISTTSMTSAVIQAITGSKDVQYSNCQFINFEIDGAAATQASYNVAGKGIYIQYMINPLFQDVYIHDTPATGFGIDHLRYGLITGCLAVNCGRLNSGSNLGGAGIGVAMGGSFPSASYPESCVVVGNSCIDNKRYGIFFEGVGTSTPVNSFVIVEGNYIHMSASSGHGIGDSGMQNMNINGNSIVGIAGCLDGISVDSGTLNVAVGVKGLIIGNTISTVRNGVSLNYTGNVASSTLCEYVIKDNKIEACASNGILVTTKASTLLDVLDISGNQALRNTLNGIFLTGTGNMKGVSIKANKAVNNSNDGLKVGCAVADLTVVGNDFLDDQSVATQVNGIEINTIAVTDALVSNNKLTGNTTNAILLTGGGTLAGKVFNNPGYNPIGPSTVTPGASPWTYTAGTAPETLYISGGTVSSVVKNSVNLGVTTPAFITLNPNDAVVITYSVVPTAVKDID